MLEFIKILFAFSSVFNLQSVKQHCPFYGTSIILIKLNETQKNKAITKLILKEIDKKNVNQCTYGDYIIKQPFLPMDSLYTENRWISIYEKKQGVSLKALGDFYVFLSSAQVDCMIKDNNEFNLKKRKFTITFLENKKQKKVAVKSNMIFKLCTAHTDWETIRPINLTL